MADVGWEATSLRQTPGNRQPYGRSHNFAPPVHFSSKNQSFVQSWCCPVCGPSRLLFSFTHLETLVPWDESLQARMEGVGTSRPDRPAVRHFDSPRSTNNTDSTSYLPFYAGQHPERIENYPWTTQAQFQRFVTLVDIDTHTTDDHITSSRTTMQVCKTPDSEA